MNFITIWCIQIIINAALLITNPYIKLIPQEAVIPIVSLINIFYSFSYIKQE